MWNITPLGDHYNGVMLGIDFRRSEPPRRHRSGSVIGQWPTPDSARSQQYQGPLRAIKGIRAGLHLSIRVGTGMDRDRSTSLGVIPSSSSASVSIVSLGL